MTNEQVKKRRQVYNKETYEWCKEHKICVRCKSEDAANGRILCDKCNEKNRMRYHNFSNEEKEHYISVQKARREAKGNAKVCLDCGEALAETSSVFCIKHLQMKRIRENRYYYKRKAAGENNARTVGAGG